MKTGPITPVQRRAMRTARAQAQTLRVAAVVCLAVAGYAAGVGASLMAGKPERILLPLASPQPTVTPSAIVVESPEPNPAPEPVLPELRPSTVKPNARLKDAAPKNAPEEPVSIPRVAPGAPSKADAVKRPAETPAPSVPAITLESVPPPPPPVAEAQPAPAPNISPAPAVVTGEPKPVPMPVAETPPKPAEVAQPAALSRAEIPSTAKTEPAPSDGEKNKAHKGLFGRTLDTINPFGD